MPVITLTTPSNGRNARRDASFSSYLSENEENFVLTLSGRKKTEDKEIDVFDAHRYFNEAGTNQASKIVKKDFPYVDLGKKDDAFDLSVKTRRWTSSPSILSESSCKSSCNSRNRLMHGVSRNQQPGKMNKRITFLDIIGCSCIGKDSNDSHDYVVENQKPENCNCVKCDEPGLRLNSDSHFSFPVFGPNPGNHEEDGTNKRKSLEVFGSPELDDMIYSRGLEKKFNMFAWNDVSSGRVVNRIKIPPISGGIDWGIDLDESFRESDASLETFETDSIPKSGGVSLSRLQGLGSLSGRRFYAPSEASVEWSVITASAADFSALSDSDGFTSASHIKTGKKVKNSSSIVETPKLFLSGCKNQKSVRVAGNVQKPNTKG
ncbi:protein PHYTOCHROME KINASE SUBSTRATE 2 [Dorcoceras hygrometricum]|uniref:Protein PHYTOCHROME KINASE SUBSTRATE 2 n=1 Tax=Dorcoceras hygrometricum TaxID=472368 RepID=A0A2Z7A8C7_9LAMI|nr:protein PHYTOCHROME KINASE SUBSTRATE 2 [Dorcoceras hygrometricum]